MARPDRRLALLALGLALPLGGCLSETTSGNLGGPVTGSAGPGGVQAASTVQRCDRPIATAALLEAQSPAYLQTLASFGLGSPLPVLRLIMQQSGCFRVVERGQGMAMVMGERGLARGGEMRRGDSAAFGMGRMTGATLGLTPNLIFSGNTGGGGGGAGLARALPGWYGVAAGAIAGSVRFNSAQAILTLVDNSSTEQVAVAEGNATSRDINVGGALFGGGWGGAGGGGAGAYGNTPEGRVIAAALVDAHNNLVRTLRPGGAISGR